MYPQHGLTYLGPLGNRVNPLTYTTRVGADHTVAAASAVHSHHRLQPGATWPGISYRHLSSQSVGLARFPL